MSKKSKYIQYSKYNACNNYMDPYKNTTAKGRKQEVTLFNSERHKSQFSQINKGSSVLKRRNLLKLFRD